MVKELEEALRLTEKEELKRSAEEFGRLLKDLRKLGGKAVVKGSAISLSKFFKVASKIIKKGIKKLNDVEKNLSEASKNAKKELKDL